MKADFQNPLYQYIDKRPWLKAIIKTILVKLINRIVDYLIDLIM